MAWCAVAAEASAYPTGRTEAELPFREVLNGGKGPRVWYLCIVQSLDVDVPRVGASPWARQLPWRETAGPISRQHSW